MDSSKNNSLTLLGAFIGAGLAWTNLHGELAALAGVALIAVLFAYDLDAYRSGGQSVAFAAVTGMILMVTLFPIKAWLSPEPDPAPGFFTKYLGALIWICATFAVFLFDRARMGARDSFSLRMQQAAVPAMAARPPAPPVVAAMPVARYEPVTVPAAPVPEPVPVPAAAPFTATAIYPVVPEPAAEPVPAVPAAQPVPLQTAPVPQGGKPVTIYVNLVGEGLNMMRQVQAEHLGRDFYIIVEQMPPGETWEFGTGQVVKCRKKNLSNGKGLVAYEEAPRAQ